MIVCWEHKNERRWKIYFIKTERPRQRRRLLHKLRNIFMRYA